MWTLDLDVPSMYEICHVLWCKSLCDAFLSINAYIVFFNKMPCIKVSLYIKSSYVCLNVCFSLSFYMSSINGNVCSHHIMWCSDPPICLKNSIMWHCVPSIPWKMCPWFALICMVSICMYYLRWPWYALNP